MGMEYTIICGDVELLLLLMKGNDRMNENGWEKGSGKG
jgi:hypothetical protein